MVCPLLLLLGGGKFANGAVTGAFGYLFNCVAHRCYELRNPEGGMLSFYGTPAGSHFGQPSTLSSLYDVEWRWSGAGETARIEVGNISLEYGGHPDHRTHQDGLDVDIRPMRSGGSGPLTWRSSNYDRAATQRFVDTIRATSPNATIYFNDPKIRGVQPFSGHNNHLHVRFR